MKNYQSISEFVRNYFVPNQFGFDDWVIVKFTHIIDRNVVLVSLANPVLNEFQQVTIGGVSPEQLETFKTSYREHYAAQFEKRFGFFLPGRRTGDVEYETFELFQDFWIEAEGKSVLPYNIPLLYDFPTDLEYEEARIEGTIGVNYQRLLVVVAQPRKRHIKFLYIKNVDEQKFVEIKKFVAEQVTKNTRELF